MSLRPPHPGEPGFQDWKDMADACDQAGIAGAGCAPAKYDDVLVPFVALMRNELHANSAKGDRPGWLAMDANTALLEVYWHAAKLSAAVKNKNHPNIMEHSADVANMAMMVLDVCVGLEWVNDPNRAERESYDRSMGEFFLPDGSPRSESGNGDSAAMRTAGAAGPLGDPDVIGAPINYGTVPVSVPADLPPLPKPYRAQGAQLSYDGFDVVHCDLFTIEQLREYARAALATSAPPPEADQLRAGVRQIVTALRDKEWADLLATDPDLLDLEVEVGKLIGARG